MVAISETAGRSAQANRQLAAANHLLNGQFFQESTVMYWLSVRSRLFGWLEERGIFFDSTRVALVAALSNPELREVAADLTFVYTAGTLAEWDESVSVTAEHAAHFKHTCESLLFQLEA